VKYYFSRTLRASFEEAFLKIAEELKKEGFGVITKIDMKETLKEKLGVDFRKYTIIGACNPSFAYKALQIDHRAGLMLPCKLIVQEVPGGETEVYILDPIVAIAPINNPELSKLAEGIRDKLKRVINNM